MAVMTDGGGGFADSQLGAMYFGLNLTDSVVARTHLPMIRKQEIINAGTKTNQSSQRVCHAQA